MTEALKQLTARLLDSYAEIGAINHIDGVNLPDRQTVERITMQLLHLLFPGYYQNLSISGGDLEGQVNAILNEIAGQLRQEIVKSLDYRPPANSQLEELEEVAHRLTCQFLGRLPQVREVLVTDVEAAYDGDPRLFWLIRDWKRLRCNGWRMNYTS